MNALKYFKEKAGSYHVIATGSLLGTLLAQPKSYPVGMVNLLDIGPLTFDEFLEATDEMLYVYYRSIRKEQAIEEIFHLRLLEAYNNYLIIGGMPECVASWMKYKDPAKVAQIQRELISIYENDFSKYNGRARDFEEAIEWLVSAGMLNRVYNVSKMEHPLAAFAKLDQFKGPLTENFVLQQLKGQFEIPPHYFSDKHAEIDFVLQYGTEIIPVEVKGGEDRSAPSLKRYVADHQPAYALRFSKRGYRKDGRIINMPLYLARRTRELL